MNTDNKTGIIYREGTFDEYILRETKSYFPLKLRDSDIVLDIGGHIGCFASRVKIENPNVHLLSIEAEKSNYDVLMLNSVKYRFVGLHRAVVKDSLHGEYVNLYVNSLKNNALHSVVPVRGRETQTVIGVGFSSILDSWHPTVIKCDIEGGEYDLPWESVRNHNVRTIVMELHLTKKGHRDEARRMLDKMSNLGYSLTRFPNIGEKNWTTLVTWNRN